MSSETRKYAWSFLEVPVRTRGGGKGKEEETDPFDGPAEDGRLEVFRVCKIATLEDGD
jgi:hypothetical protein